MYIVLEVTKHLPTVIKLTRDVAHWYSLGVFLRISEASLQRIKCKYGGYTQEGLNEMLQIWLETRRATWSELVHSLCKVGYTSLAKKIAAEIGKLMSMGLLFTMSCPTVVHSLFAVEYSVYRVLAILTLFLPAIVPFL